MTTILDILKEQRQVVIDRYNQTTKGISLKDYMNIVLWYFNVHKNITSKVVKNWEKGASHTFAYHAMKACEIASAKANKAFFADVVEMQAKRLNATEWYNKNYK